MADQQPAGGSDVLTNAVKIAGEAVVAPGTSLLLEGQIVPGIVHVAAGLVARSFFGPIGWVLVAMNSYAQSTTGRHLGEHAQTAAARPQPATEVTVKK